MGRSRASIDIRQSGICKSPETLDGGTASATAAVVISSGLDQCCFDDNPARKNCSRMCGVFSLIASAFAFLSSTASVNQNFADAKKERANAKEETALRFAETALRFAETALRFELQDLHRQRESLETKHRFDLQDLQTKHRFDLLERMIKNLAGGPPVEPPVEIDSISTQIEEIDSKIKEKQDKLNRINGSKEGSHDVYNELH